MANAADLERWVAIDERLESMLDIDDDILSATLADSDAAGMPPIAVSPLQGRLLQSLARIDRGATHPGGGDARWLQHHLAGARGAGGRTPRDPGDRRPSRRRGAPNIARAGLGDLVEVRVGDGRSRVSRRWRPPAASPSTWCSSMPTSGRTPSTSRCRCA